MIFETERLLIRKLTRNDINGFYKLQSNPEVLKYALGEVESFEAIEKDMNSIINRYSIADNNFWIYAIENKVNKQFLGTVALIKDDKGDDEIGYRFIQEFWGKGYGFEVCKGLVLHAKKLKVKKLIAYVIDENLASIKILEKLSFKVVGESKKCVNIKLPETKYELIL